MYYEMIPVSLITVFLACYYNIIDCIPYAVCFTTVIYFIKLKVYTS